MTEISSSADRSILTIGHSNHEVYRFIALLKAHDVTAVADVRSQPWSRYNPQFNREVLRRSLEREGIAYFFHGHELGARTDDRTCYSDGRVQYERLAETGPFRRGLDHITERLLEYRLALMCAEKDPLVCHRTILICRHLADRGIEIQHILEDGSTEDHDAALTRLLSELHMPESDLFMSRDDLIAEAYARRGAQIAYREDPEKESERTQELPG